MSAKYAGDPMLSAGDFRGYAANLEAEREIYRITHTMADTSYSPWPLGGPVNPMVSEFMQ